MSAGYKLSSMGSMLAVSMWIEGSFTFWQALLATTICLVLGFIADKAGL